MLLTRSSRKFVYESWGCNKKMKLDLLTIMVCSMKIQITDKAGFITLSGILDESPKASGNSQLL